MTPRAPIGYRVTQTYCRGCAPEGLRDYYAPMREGDDHGVPSCDVCGEGLTPCGHEWGEWCNWVWGGRFRGCTLDGCSETQHTDMDGNPIARPEMPADAFTRSGA